MLADNFVNVINSQNAAICPDSQPIIIIIIITIGSACVVQHYPRFLCTSHQFFPDYGTCLFQYQLNSLGSIQPLLPSQCWKLFKHTSNNCPTRYPFTPWSRECRYRWSALPKDTVSHRSSQDLLIQNRGLQLLHYDVFSCSFMSSRKSVRWHYHLHGHVSHERYTVSIVERWERNLHRPLPQWAWGHQQDWCACYHCAIGPLRCIPRLFPPQIYGIQNSIIYGMKLSIWVPSTEHGHWYRCSGKRCWLWMVRMSSRCTELHALSTYTISGHLLHSHY